MPSRQIEDLHPDLQPICRQFIEQCTEAGLNILITCTFRSPEEQTLLFQQGRYGNKGPIVTKARAGESLHNALLGGKPAARAFDIVPIVNGKPEWTGKHPDWQVAGKIGMSLGLNWYGRPDAPFREMPHFELPVSQKGQ